MAPTKFEEIIKEKLDNRQLQPSPDAWDKLSERLENQEKKQKTLPLWQLGIAASLMGILMVTAYFHKSDTIESKIVDTPKVTEQDESTQITSEKKADFINDQKETRASENTQPIENSIFLKKQLEAEQTAVVKNTSVQELKKEPKKTEQTHTENLTFEAQKIKELVAHAQQLKETNTEVTEADIDALLLEAQKEIRLKHIYNKNTRVVDANALLQDVEADLEQSFRSRVFQALKDNYITVKTAVAQRND